MDYASKFKIGTLDHITHIDNLDTILQHGLLAHNNPYKQKEIRNKDVVVLVFHKTLQKVFDFVQSQRNNIHLFNFDWH